MQHMKDADAIQTQGQLIQHLGSQLDDQNELMNRNNELNAKYKAACKL